jgi:hypothetical protein
MSLLSTYVLFLHCRRCRYRFTFVTILYTSFEATLFMYRITRLICSNSKCLRLWIFCIYSTMSDITTLVTYGRVYLLNILSAWSSWFQCHLLKQIGVFHDYSHCFCSDPFHSSCFSVLQLARHVSLAVTWQLLMFWVTYKFINFSATTTSFVTLYINKCSQKYIM